MTTCFFRKIHYHDGGPDHQCDGGKLFSGSCENQYAYNYTCQWFKEEWARYRVGMNFCRCHPESCNCDKWAIYDVSIGSEYENTREARHTTYFSREKAEDVCDALNVRDKLRRK